MTDWEARYQAGDMPWEKGCAAPPLVELLAKRGRDIWLAGRVLVPGCGYGHDVREIAKAGADVLGLDLAVTALERARQFPRAGGEFYELGDFLDPGWREGRKFSAIWEHTCFCAIDPSQRQAYAESAAGLLEEGSWLAGVFFLTPHDPGEASKGPPFPSTIEEIEDLLSPWFERVDGWVPEHAYPGREGREWIGLFRRTAEP
jgi:SAM-dependent methyltransferase